MNVDRIRIDHKIRKAIERFRKARWPVTVGAAVDAFVLILKAYEAEEKRLCDRARRETRSRVWE